MSRIAAALVLLGAFPAMAEDLTAVSAGYRLMGLPDFAYGSSAADHQPFYGHGVALSYDTGDTDAYWTVGMGILPLATPDGYWRAADVEVSEGAFAEFEVTYLSFFAAHSWRFDIANRFYLLLTGGLGVVFVAGDIYVTELVAGCEGDITTCGHWREVTRHPVEIEYRVLPAVQASASAGYEVLDALNVSLDAGFFNLPFVGLSAQYRM
jgi:hypothetical protein